MTPRPKRQVYPLVQGVTIFAAAGDSGVHNADAATKTRSCGYSPLWPASSPWVTAVGATVVEREESQMSMFLPFLDYSHGWLSSLAATRIAFGLSSGFGQAKETERAADADSGGGAAFSTGGGFSERYAMPPLQHEAVTDYLASQAGADAWPGFNRAGRGYPDISMVGNKLLVVLDGRLYFVSGTSAATPIVAAIAARVNLVRESNGLPQLGSLNPTLYAHHGKSPSMSLVDITKGANRCPMPRARRLPLCRGICGDRWVGPCEWPRCRRCAGAV
jgi:tripeptidyl-peptidase I